MSEARRWRSSIAEAVGPELELVLAVAIPAVVALVVAIMVFLFRANVPIGGDGGRILAERYPLTADTILIPLHRQLNALPILLWGMLEGPAPKLALLLALHVALTTVTAAFLASRIGPTWTLALILPLAVSGTSNYDLRIPWQIVFVLPMLLVMIATWLSVEREDRSPRRRLAVAVLVGLAVLSSNVGVVAVFALGLWFVLERRWRQLLELTPAALLFAVWFVLYSVPNESSPIAHAGHFTRGSPVVVPLYIASGIAHGIGGWLGIRAHLASIAAIVLILAFVAYVVVRGIRIPPATFAFFAGIFAMFAALSLIRSDASVHQAGSGRYYYLVLFMLAAGLGAAAWPKARAWRWLIVIGVVAGLANLRVLFRALGAT